MANVPLNNILRYVNSFPLTKSDRSWLAEKLVSSDNEERHAAELKELERRKVFDRLCGCWIDDEEADKMEHVIMSVRGVKCDKERTLIPFDD